ncbi:MAG: cyclic nucleotide-binding domain-containing protein [Chitinophagaceae bacterium]|nr:cyclic nucleotide-binding domain-containing protein [Chitinophagaceae bacterium]
MDQLLQLLTNIGPMSPALLAHLRSIIRPMRFKKGELILEAGTIASHIYYIESGLVRSYYMLNEKEVSNWFMKEGDLFISVLSFFRRTPSVENHVALEDCVCWGTSYDELEKTYELFPEFHNHGRIISNEYYCRHEERQMLDTSVSKSEQSNPAISKATLATLSSGEFVGILADDPGKKLALKTFHAEIVKERVEVGDEVLPVVREVSPGEIEENFRRIKREVAELVDSEMLRIMRDPVLKGRVG